MPAEQLHFKIGLSGTFNKKRPVFSIAIDDTVVVAHQTIQADSDVVEYFEFDHDADDGPHVIKIAFENKAPGDTVENADKTGIISDLLLNVVSIAIDDIELGHLCYTMSKYHVNTPVIQDGKPVSTITNCINLGWNGEWQLEYTSPFYIWMLENV